MSVASPDPSLIGTMTFSSTTIPQSGLDKPMIRPSRLQIAHELEDRVGMPRNCLMTIVRTHHQLLWRAYLVVGGELRRRRAHRIHESYPHHHPLFDSRGQVLDVDIAKLCEDLILAFMQWIEFAEEILQFKIGILSLGLGIKLPDRMSRIWPPRRSIPRPPSVSSNDHAPRGSNISASRGPLV